MDTNKSLDRLESGSESLLSKNVQAKRSCPITSTIQSKASFPTTYIYSPLSKTDSEIRLLEIISPGNSISPTRCRLHTVRMSDSPIYTALFYVWGDPLITEEMILDGTLFNITKSLGSALRLVKYYWSHLYPDRDPAEFRLWADAICIYQGDLAERNHQVKLMGQIYSEAETAIRQLASEDRLVHTAIKTYKYIHEVLFDLKSEKQRQTGSYDLFPYKGMCHYC